MTRTVDREVPAIRVADLACHLGARDVLCGVALTIEAASVVGILGPNGCGKTTLLRCIAGLHRPTRGVVSLARRDVTAIRPAILARQVAIQAQDQVAALGFSAREIVGMGRLAHRSGLFAGGDAGDDRIVAHWLEVLELTPLADRLIESLSGGERQRVTLARALAQEPRVLLLDEPTNHLDVRHRFVIMEQIRALGIMVVAALHEIEFAGRVCDRIILLHEGRVLADGPPESVLTPANIATTYGVEARVDRQPSTGQIRIDLQPQQRGSAP